jgi:xanthine dehydrogenase accessory factor
LKNMALDLEFHERIARLGRAGESFAVAIVVGRRPPVSSHLGDHAIVFADGRMEGFVGGACSHEIVRTQALDVLASGRARIVSIEPDARRAESSSDRVIVPMTCVSEGAMDIYIEPVVPVPLLVVVGATPIASALARIGRSVDYRVVRVVDARERADIESDADRFGFAVDTLDALGEVLKPPAAGPDTRAVVVASQGHYDEEAIATALKCGVPYVGLVASRTRGTTVKRLLEEQGVPGVAALHSPAGLDLGARTAAEVALSILGEIVQRSVREGPDRPVAGRVAPAAAPSVAVDPVCHMDVDVPTARHTVELDGVTYYFCSAGCKARFVKQPQDYLSRTP